MILALLAASCHTTPGTTPGTAPGTAPQEARAVAARAPADAPERGRVYAYVAGQPVTGEALLPALMESAGGEVFGDAVLDRLIARRLAAAGVTVTDAMLDAERAVVAQTLSDDPDQAARMLRDLRERRGLGETRFEALIRRNAGLRALVAGRVTVTQPALRQAYRLRHGPATRVRLIVTDTLGQAQRLRRRAVEDGEPFGELAAMHSTDASAAQGGLLSPIRPDDTSYPASLRDAIAPLTVGQVSGPVAVDGGFALVRIEEQIAGDGVAFEAAEQALAVDVRRRAQRVLMQQIARELIDAADVVVLDPVLSAAWQRRRAVLLGE